MARWRRRRRYRASRSLDLKNPAIAPAPPKEYPRTRAGNLAWLNAVAGAAVTAMGGVTLDTPEKMAAWERASLGEATRQDHALLMERTPPGNLTPQERMEIREEMSRRAETEPPAWMRQVERLMGE